MTSQEIHAKIEAAWTLPEVKDAFHTLNERIDVLEQRIRFLDDGFSGDVRAFGNRLAELEERIDVLERQLQSDINELKHQVDNLADTTS